MLSSLVTEVLQRLQTISSSHLKRPFCLSFVQWMPVLVHTYIRMGWTSETVSSERAVKAEIMKAVQVLSLHTHTVLTLGQVVSIFHRVGTSGASSREACGPCPAGLLRDAEFKSLDHLRSKFDSSRMVATPSPEGSPVSSQNPSAGSVSNRRGQTPRRLSFRSVSSHAGSPPASESLSIVPMSIAAGSEALVSESNQSDPIRVNSAVVPYNPEVQHMILANIPALPENLDDLSRAELKKALVDQHAQWLRAANQIATQASARNAIKSADKRKFRKQQQRKVLYWKKKAKKQKASMQLQYQQLVSETDVYKRSKRRKKDAFRMHLSVFGGLVLHCSINGQNLSICLILSTVRMHMLLYVVC